MFFLCSNAPMGGARKKRGRPAIIVAAVKVAMLGAIREGRRLGEVAAAYGVTLQAFYSARRRDPLFAAAWRDAHSLSAEAERRRARADRGAAPGGEVRIVPNHRRPLQRRRLRHVRFDDRRRGIFLTSFARSCNLVAAAAEAGVCERTVYNHIRKDPDFAMAFQAALGEACAWLEAEAVRMRLEGQARLRAAIDAAEAEEDFEARREALAAPLAQAGAEFDRTMKLLARWDRRDGRIGLREVGQGRQRHSTFEEAIEAIDRKLRALGLRSKTPGDGEGG